MSKRVGNTFIIEREVSQKCSTCGEEKECRPYGVGGAQVCFGCAMATPESKLEAERQFARKLGKASN